MSAPAKLISDRWLWAWSQSSGQADIKIIVSFNHLGRAPNHRAPLDAALWFCFHIGHYWRGASEHVR
jgi:hypothetical protein